MDFPRFPMKDFAIYMTYMIYWASCYRMSQAASSKQHVVSIVFAVRCIPRICSTTAEQRATE